MKTFKRYITEVLTPAQMQSVSHVVTPVTARRQNTSSNEMSFTDHIFGGPIGSGNHTIVIPFQQQLEAPDSVKTHLDSAGYKIHDYAAGLAVSKNAQKPRPIRIGSILERTKHLGTHAEAHKAFINRQTTSGDYEILLSRDPHRIYEMSTNKPWKSCMSLGNCGSEWNSQQMGMPEPEHYYHRGSNHQAIDRDITNASHVAYLIKKGDHELREPIMRVTLKALGRTSINPGGSPVNYDYPNHPLQGEHAARILIPDKVYSHPSQSNALRSQFYDHVFKFVDDKLNNHQPGGDYELGHGVYADNVQRKYSRLSEEDLKKFDLPYSPEGNQLFEKVHRTNVSQLLSRPNLHPHYLDKIATIGDFDYAHRTNNPVLMRKFDLLLGHKNFNQSTANHLIHIRNDPPYPPPNTKIAWASEEYRYRPDMVLRLMHHPKVISGEIDMSGHMDKLSHILFGDPLRRLEKTGMRESDRTRVIKHVQGHLVHIPGDISDHQETFKKSIQMLTSRINPSHITQNIRDIGRVKGPDEVQTYIKRLADFGVLVNDRHAHAVIDALQSDNMASPLMRLWYDHLPVLSASAQTRVKGLTDYWDRHPDLRTATHLMSPYSIK